MTPKQIESFYLSECDGDQTKAFRMACEKLSELVVSGFNRTKNQSVMKPKPHMEPIQ